MTRRNHKSLLSCLQVSQIQIKNSQFVNALTANKKTRAVKSLIKRLLTVNSFRYHPTQFVMTFISIGLLLDIRAKAATASFDHSLSSPRDGKMPSREQSEDNLGHLKKLCWMSRILEKTIQNG
jgi:hypothetical protein